MKMTLDEAIEHCLEAAKTITCKECADEHQQLADWLIELKELKYSNNQSSNTETDNSGVN
jgi:hypothetical protein